MPEKVAFYNFDTGKDEYREVATHEELFDFCNQVRKIGGGDILDALLPGYMGDSKNCLIAKNLNFDCQVVVQANYHQGFRTDHTNKWLMIVPNDQVIKNLHDLLGLEIDFTYIHDGGFKAGVVLPEHIGNSAEAFDKGIAFTDMHQADMYA